MSRSKKKYKVHIKFYPNPDISKKLVRLYDLLLSGTADTSERNEDTGADNEPLLLKESVTPK